MVFENLTIQKQNKMIVMLYSNQLNTQHLNTGFQWTVWVSSIQMEKS